MGDHQLSKINYLQEELAQLRDKCAELEDLLSFNRDIVKRTVAKDSGKPQNTTEALTTNDRSCSSGVRNLRNIIEHLHNENSKLLEINKKLADERDVAQSKALINEQIAEEAQRSETELANGLQQTICRLKLANQNKEKHIFELERSHKFEAGKPGVAQRETLPLSEQSLKTLNEVAALREEILNLQKENKKLEKKVKNVLSVNYVFKNPNSFNSLLILEQTLSQELTKMRQGSKRNLGEPDPEHEQESQRIVLQMHEKILGKDDSHDSSSFEEVRLEKLKKPSTIGSKDPLLGENLKKTLPLPKLDLKKAFKLQEQQIKKQTSVSGQELSETEKKYTEKIEKLERELKASKKSYEHEALLSKVVGDHNQRLRDICQELLRANEILLKGNNRLNIDRLEDKKKLDFYSGFYRKISSLFTERSLNLFQYLTYGRLNEEIEKFHEDNKTHQVFERNRLTHMDHMVTANQMEAENGEKGANVSRIDFGGEIRPEREMKIEEPEKTEEKMIYYKNYLIKLAQDLEMNPVLFEILEGQALLEGARPKRPSLRGDREMRSFSFSENFNLKD